jgi:Tfp pilus assembly protein PilF
VSRRVPILFLAGLWLVASGVGCFSLPVSTGTFFDAPNGPDSPGSARPELPPVASAKVSLTVAESMETHGQYGAAVDLYERARHNDPSLHVAQRLAPLYDRLGDMPHALAEYQRAIKENPRDADVLNSFGYFYYNRGKWSEAEEQLRRALSVSPNHKRAWVNLGLTLGEQGHYVESLEAFRKAVPEADAHSNLAFLLMTQGKRDEAKQEYRRALELNPKLAIAQKALEKLEHPGPVAARDDAGAMQPVLAQQPTGLPASALPGRRPEPEPEADVRWRAPESDLSPIVVEAPAAARTEKGN